MSDRVSLRGIDVYAHHGVLPAERDLGQLFTVDVDLFTDCTAAARSDDLVDAVNYATVHEVVRMAASEPVFNLIEAVAGNICRHLLTALAVDRVRVTVHKLNPPIPGFRGTAAVTLERDRSWLSGGTGA